MNRQSINQSKDRPINFPPTFPGTDLQPMSQAARMVLGFWWVFIIIVVSTYTASLAAVLTVTVNERSINSLIELSEQSDIQPLIKPGTNLETLFEVN